MGLTETIQRIEELYGQLLASAERAQERDAAVEATVAELEKERHELRRTVAEGKRVVRLAAERAEGVAGQIASSAFNGALVGVLLAAVAGGPRRGVPLRATALAPPPLWLPRPIPERGMRREVSRDTSGPPARHVADRLTKWVLDRS